MEHTLSWIVLNRFKNMIKVWKYDWYGDLDCTFSANFDWFELVVIFSLVELYYKCLTQLVQWLLYREIDAVAVTLFNNSNILNYKNNIYIYIWNQNRLYVHDDNRVD